MDISDAELEQDYVLVDGRKYLLTSEIENELLYAVLARQKLHRLARDQDISNPFRLRKVYRPCTPHIDWSKLTLPKQTYTSTISDEALGAALERIRARNNYSVDTLLEFDSLFCDEGEDPDHIEEIELQPTPEDTVEDWTQLREWWAQAEEQKRKDTAASQILRRKVSRKHRRYKSTSSDYKRPSRVQEVFPEDIESEGTGKDLGMTGTEKAVESPTKGHDKPLVLGRTKPTHSSTPSMDSGKEPAAPSAEAKAAFNHEIAKNLQSNTGAAAPADEATIDNASTPVQQPAKSKKEKAPKQAKPPKAPAAPAAPLSPALIDLRVGHILRCVTHPNADSLFVSTIAMGDPEGAEHSQVDEETGKVVRTVCSGLNGLIPIEEMQNRKIIVVANLKPVTMRGIKSAAMVLAASPKMEEGADPHAADRVVELVMPPEESEAGEKVYFEGWPYGDGRGPEKQLNPKKKVWEGIQPGFYTSDDLAVGFDAEKSEVGGTEKGDLVVEGKGRCTVKSLKGAVVR